MTFSLPRKRGKMLLVHGAALTIHAGDIKDTGRRSSTWHGGVCWTDQVTSVDMCGGPLTLVRHCGNEWSLRLGKAAPPKEQQVTSRM